VHRGGDPRQGPLAQAVSEFMADALVRNDPLGLVPKRASACRPAGTTVARLMAVAAATIEEGATA
jgi:hypothetical protein